MTKKVDVDLDDKVSSDTSKARSEAGRRSSPSPERKSKESDAGAKPAEDSGAKTPSSTAPPPSSFILKLDRKEQLHLERASHRRELSRVNLAFAEREYELANSEAKEAEEDFWTMTRAVGIPEDIKRFTVKDDGQVLVAEDGK